MRNIRKEIGITLIALVITIIVLLILAGVAIAMLSGENGILRKAAEAKTKTEEGQKREETTLTDMDLDSHFIINNSKYKCKYGMITGIEEGTTVIQLESSLPEGYTITKKYDFSNKIDVNITEDKNSLVLATGMVVEKNNKEYARIVLFGDVNCTGTINGTDTIDVQSYLSSRTMELKDFIKAAMDTNHDGNISMEDSNLISEAIGNESIKIQNSYATNPSSMKKLGQSAAEKEYVDSVSSELTKINASFDYDEENGTYILKVPKGTKVSEVTSLLNNSKIKSKRKLLGDDEVLPEDSSLIEIFIDIEEKYGITQLIFKIKLI